MKQKDPHEMAGGDLVKVKAGFWCVGLQDEVPLQPHFFWRRRGRERKDSPVFRLLHIGL